MFGNNKVQQVFTPSFFSSTWDEVPPDAPAPSGLYFLLLHFYFDVFLLQHLRKHKAFDIHTPLLQNCMQLV
jgi:hypothetical protein